MDANRIKQDFQVYEDKTLCYLDSAASSLKPDRVINVLDEYYKKYGVNVHRGVYNLSYIATEKYESSRQTIADFINADFDEVIFTRGASNALNVVALSYGMAHVNEGDEIIVNELEHHSQLLPWQQVAKAKKAKLVYIPLTIEGRITTENFQKVLTNKTKVVAINHTSNVMGYITPLEEIIPLAHEVGAVVSVDAAQGVPHQKIDVKSLDADFLAFSGHKMLGPTGIGVLYGKKALLKEMSPVEYGGDMIDSVEKYESVAKDAPYKFETGTPPIGEAIALGEAVRYIEELGYENIREHEQALKEYTIKEMQKIEGVTIYNPTVETGIIAFNIDGVHPHDAVTYFDGDNICMRAGHHCAQLVTRWLNVVATLRISYYVYNTFEDADQFLTSLKGAVAFFKSVGF
ncbi:MAG: aminotransferase class V-fold PLP-dependent enzyme [Candidatus Izemoplasmataceae bacterium]